MCGQQVTPPANGGSGAGGPDITKHHLDTFMGRRECSAGEAEMFWWEKGATSLSPPKQPSRLTCHPLISTSQFCWVTWPGHLSPPCLFSESSFSVTHSVVSHPPSPRFGMSNQKSLRGDVVTFSFLWRCESSLFLTANDSYAPGSFPIPPALPSVHVALLHFPFSSLKALPSGCQASANRPAPLSIPVLFQIWGSGSSH